MFISCRQHTSSGRQRMPRNVFRLYFALPSESDRVAHCNRFPANCIHCSYGFRNRKLIDGASLSLVYFASAFFLPSHLSVRSRFICHDSAQFRSLSVLFYIYIYLALFFIPSSFLRSPDRLFAATVTPDSLVLYLFISHPSLAIIDIAGFTLVTSPISRVSVSPKCTAVRAYYYVSYELVVARYRSAARIADGEWRETRRLGKRNYDVHGDNPFS